MSRIRVALALLAFTNVASAQHAGHGSAHVPSAGETSSGAAMGKFAVRIHGAFRDFMQKQDYSSKIALPDVRASGATDAVGALSGLRGEVTFVDGQPIVSYGGCAHCTLKHGETAALLGSAKVTRWADGITLPVDLKGKALDDFIIAQGKSAGLDLAQPFPIRIVGTLIDVEMHVIEAPNSGFTGHGSKVHMAKQDEFRHASIDGLVVGFFAPASLQGTLTHPGDPFHFHWVADDRKRTAHLDAFGMKAGARLYLPKS